MPKCPQCGDENHIYAKADIRWENGAWEVSHIEEQLECTECDESFYYGEAGFDQLPELDLVEEA